MSPKVKLDLIVLCLCMLPAVVISFIKQPSPRLFDRTVFMLVPHALIVIVATYLIKKAIESDKNRFLKNEYTGNGLTKISEAQYRQNCRETTKRELEKLKSSVVYKEALARKGYAPE